MTGLKSKPSIESSAAWRLGGSLPARRGTIYVLVLGIAMLVTIIGLAALQVARLGVRSQSRAIYTTEAETLAVSAVEYALHKTAVDASWRTDYTSGTASSELALGRGYISFKFLDEVDGNLSNNTTDSVRIYGIGRVGTAVKLYSVNCTVSVPLNCLAVALDAGGNLTTNTTTVTGTATFSSNGNITASSSEALNGTNLEAAGTIAATGTTGTGWRLPGAAARTLPDSAHVFDFYTSAANSPVTISFGSIPVVSGTATINRQIISPTLNTLGGGTSASGLYVINCNASPLIISNSRIVGTLVLLNASSVTIQSTGVLEPAVSNYPTLLVQGNLTFALANTQLQENPGGAVTAVNFNPTGLPLPYNGGTGGTANTTSSDSFNSQFSGLLYVTGTLTVSTHPVVKGVIICAGAASMSGAIDPTYDVSFYNNPPPGFLSSQVAPVSATWRWEKAP